VKHFLAVWQECASVLLVQHQLRYLKKELNDPRSIPTNHLVHYYLCPKLLDALSLGLRGISASTGIPITAASQLIDHWMPIIPQLNEIRIEKAVQPNLIAPLFANAHLSTRITLMMCSMILLVPRLLSHISLKQLTLAHHIQYLSRKRLHVDA
jgi:hypothetical protein